MLHLEIDACVDGSRRVTVSGFAGKPEIRRNSGVVTVEAEGLRLSFQGASIRTTGEELLVPGVGIEPTRGETLGGF